MKMGGSEQFSEDIKVAFFTLACRLCPPPELRFLQSGPNEAIPKMASLPFRI